MPNDLEAKDVNDAWIEWHCVNINSPDWGSWSHTISYSINDIKDGAIIWVGMNAYNQSMVFQLPKSNSNWLKILDTKETKSLGFSKENLSNQNEIKIQSQSLVLLATKKHANKL